MVLEQTPATAGAAAAQASPTAAGGRKGPSNLMPDAVVGCRRREEPQNLCVKDRAYWGPDTGSNGS